MTDKIAEKTEKAVKPFTTDDGAEVQKIYQATCPPGGKMRGGILPDAKEPIIGPDGLRRGYRYTYSKGDPRR